LHSGRQGNKTRQAANPRFNPEPVTFFAFLYPDGTSLKCKGFTIVCARCVPFGSSPACAIAQPYQGSFLTARMLRKKITADLLAANADLSDRKKLTPRGCFIFMNDAKNHWTRGTFWH
jgi:hypothetical protein